MFSNTLRVAHERGLDLMVAQSALGGRVTGVLAVSFSADRTRIVTGLSDKNVRLWDAATGQPLGEPLRGHTGAVSLVLAGRASHRVWLVRQDCSAVGYTYGAATRWDSHRHWFL